MAFYDVSAETGSAAVIPNDAHLKALAQDLARALKTAVKGDWPTCPNIRGQVGLAVKHALRRHHYSSELESAAAKMALQPAEALTPEWLTAIA